MKPALVFRPAPPGSPSPASMRERGSTACACCALVVLAAALIAPDRARATSPSYTQSDYLFIMSRDLSGPGGAFSLMDMHPPWPHDDNYGALSQDGAARMHEGLIYVINRGSASNIQVIDPQQDFQTIRQFSVGAGSNPQDICFVGPARAFVTRYESAGLWEINPVTGEHTDTIDLSPLADADGLPEMQSLALHEDTLYVTIQRLDRDNFWIPVPPSYLAMIDVNTNAIIDADPSSPGLQGFALAATNPYSMNSCRGILPDPINGDFLISELGDYGVFDGGIERFDPGSRTSLGMVVDENTLGGDLNAWITTDGRQGFAICSGPPPGYLTLVVAFDLFSGENDGVVASSSDYAYADLYMDPSRRQLFVADRSYANPGIRVFDSDTHVQLTANPISVGLYPLTLLGCHGPQSDVPGRPIAADPFHLSACPQPASGALTLRFELAREDLVRMDVLDMSGRIVARPAAERRPAGSQALCWTACDLNGRPLPAGTYFVRIDSGGRREARGICLIR
ncbi:MAG: hypothetical protein V1774_06650 [Candidatus Eisenbacteria bacterium]